MGGLPTSTVNGFAAHPTNAKLMYVAMREGVFRSDNGGQAWSRVAGGPANAAAVAINPRRPADVYAATMQGSVFVSRDDGRTWAPVR